MTSDTIKHHNQALQQLDLRFEQFSHVALEVRRLSGDAWAMNLNRRSAGRMLIGLIAVPLAVWLGGSPLRAESSAQAFAQRVTAYRYRPDLFDDQRLHTGLSDTAQALEGALWYIRMEEYERASFGMENLARFLQAQQIPGLDFSGHRTLTDADLERLFQFDLWRPSAATVGYRFRLLKLRGTQITDRAMATIGRLMELQVLELNGRATNAGLPYLSRLQKLKVLSLEGAVVSDQGLSSIGALHGLKALNLKNTPVTDAGLAALSSLPLRHLSLGPRITDQGLGALGKVRTLEQLDLSQSHVTAIGLSRLNAIPGIHTLFLGSSISDPDLACLIPYKNLKRLDLTSARVTNAGADSLAQMSELEELALTRTRMGNRTLQKLARLPKLRYLEFSDTQVTPAGFQELKGFAALQVLSLSSRTKLTAADLAPLTRFPQLHTLIINGTPLGRPIVDFLRRKSEERSRWMEWLVPWVEAEAVTDKTVDEALEAATAPEKDKKRPIQVGFGLPLIHETESSLDEIIPAVSNPSADTVQENEKNFLGEFTVGVPGSPSKVKS